MRPLLLFILLLDWAAKSGIQCQRQIRCSSPLMPSLRGQFSRIRKAPTKRIKKDTKTSSDFVRVKSEYIRGMADMLGFQVLTGSAGSSLIVEEQDRRNQFFMGTGGLPLVIAGHEAIAGLNSRLDKVTGGHSFGDLAEAVT